ncbi:uncharacterized protein LOC111902277 [Lactuca sativa]|uniref:uncharacterized protein LOC111902277 n=1 Tax=Lactuca sativa TaxID=4236 RepID=UPI000CD8EA1C|nr:uncharacterized protein LOC111902277 [Lactuca sativa]
MEAPSHDIIWLLLFSFYMVALLLKQFKREGEGMLFPSISGIFSSKILVTLLTGNHLFDYDEFSGKETKRMVEKSKHGENEERTVNKVLQNYSKSIKYPVATNCLMKFP